MSGHLSALCFVATFKQGCDEQYDALKFDVYFFAVVGGPQRRLLVGNVLRRWCG